MSRSDNELKCRPKKSRLSLQAAVHEDGGTLDATLSPYLRIAYSFLAGNY